VSTAASTGEKPIRRRGLFLLKLGITASAFAFILTRQPLGELWRAFREMSPFSLLLASSVHFVTLAVGALRWRILMRAYGATNRPPLTLLLKVYLIGQFYNTYLPGAVGGDLIRGVVTRNAFTNTGATGAMAVVLVERALGLAGVLGLTAISVTVFAGERFGNLLPYAMLGLVGVAMSVTGLALGRRLARFFPQPIKHLLGSLPELVGYGNFAMAAFLSLVTHAIVATAGHVLISSISAAVPWSYSLVAMPLAGAAGFFPLTLAGAGARDQAMISLYGALGVPKAVATAASLGFLLSTLLAAGVGGIVQLLSPVDIPKDPSKV